MASKLENQKKKKITLIIVLILLMSCFLSFIYGMIIKNLTFHNVYSNIKELSEQTSSQLQESIQNQMKFVDMVVDFINSGYITKEEEVFRHFESELASYHFTRLVILDESGNGQTSDNHIVKNYPNMEEFFSTDQIYLSENRPSTVTQNQVNIYSKTFDWKGEKKVLFATINTEDYKEILARRLFNGEGRTYLLNKDGEILIDSLEDIHQDNITFWDSIQNNNKIKSQDQKKIEQMRKEMQENKTGVFHLKLGSEIQFLAYEKVNLNSWYVVTLAKGSAIAKDLNTFLSISIGLSFAMILILILIFLSIYYLNQQKNKRLYEVAYIDSITKLGNETFFKEKSKEFLNSNHKNKYIAMFDINKFKHFNKIYEDKFCNEILKSFGSTLKRKLPKDNVVCRIRGDVFIASFSYQGKIETLMNQLFKELEKISVFTMTISLNTSIGLYKLSTEEQDFNRVLDKVEIAHAKSKGPYNSNYYLFDESLEMKLLEEEQIELNMEQSLKEGEFHVYYQPKVYVKNGRLAGAEALVRWQKEDLIIPPNKFIPLFEKNKFIIKLDLYVFEEVCKNMQEWQKMWRTLPTISVNVSKEHFTDENFIEDYVRLADKYGIPHQKIDLEITESATVDDTIDIVKIIDNIKKQNFIVSLDDFGVGYSSLGMLQQLNIDIIKIDKTFIDQANLKSEQNIINYISLMSQKMGVKTIVEGIETQEQVVFIQKLACDMIQGYYYSKPIPKEDFEEYVKQYRK